MRNLDGNLALGRTATQSTTGYSLSAERAVDGTTNGDLGLGSVTHTSETPLETNPWWQVDLGSSQPISSIELWNRTDCCANRLRDFYVFASDTPFASNDPLATKNQAGVWTHHQDAAAGTTLSLPVNRDARYVRVQLGGSDRPLSLAEVQVFANDLALYKPATQSSTGTGGGNAEWANDGNTNGRYSDSSVSHTVAGEANPWWQVDLGSVQAVNGIKMWNRTDCCTDRLRDFYVFASDTPFTSNDPETIRQSGAWSFRQSAAVESVLTLPVGRTPRYVRVQLVGSDRPCPSPRFRSSPSATPDRGCRTSSWPPRHEPDFTPWVEYDEGNSRKPSWCLAVRMTFLKPASLNVAAHWSVSRSVGLKTSGSSVPSPHSRPVKVLGPKWTNPVSSSRCQASCRAVGVTAAAFAMICA
ncbi:discoidin domain-containing protein [Nonomuraea sp. SMC257]|uniref:Discoidin domain-containing protein n=1 Tax=Nonomuraea montanisoli TaxID=2741721 RepID=A0A7Y6IAQ3_9ACTN|nr:discoidin domain-containing protein [Nonomuraea montanisoli]NUW34611.1 discoidin domain-containing protein [Nonomuraea montanisoli]